MKVLNIIILLLSVNLAFAQEFKKQDVPYNLRANKADISNYNLEYSQYIRKGFNATHLLPKGYLKTGKVDYTNYLQDAINKYRVVILPDFPILINDKGLKLRNNSVLLFQQNSKLVLKPSGRTNYEIINIHQRKNVKVFFANIQGDKYRHLSKEGQWGFGISIRASENIEIINPTISKTWGDGIYIGQISNVPSSNVKIFNAQIDDARRNGISITSARHVDIINPLLSNTNGNSPQSGLDIEPNSNLDVISDINVINPVTFNNNWSGILIVLLALEGKNDKAVDINISNHKDINSKHGFAFHGLLRKVNNNFDLTGNVRLNNTNYKGNKAPYYFYNSDFSKIKINTNSASLKEKASKHRFIRKK